MPILAMLEEIHHQLMGWYAERQFSERNTIGGIVSGIATKIQKLINERAQRYRYVHGSVNGSPLRNQIARNFVGIHCQSCFANLQLSRVAIQGTCNSNYANLRGIHAVMYLLLSLAKAKISKTSSNLSPSKTTQTRTWALSSTLITMTLCSHSSSRA